MFTEISKKKVFEKINILFQKKRHSSLISIIFNCKFLTKHQNSNRLSFDQQKRSLQVSYNESKFISKTLN